MKTMKAVLRTLLVLFAATAVIAGLLAIIHSNGTESTPFRAFFVPGVILAFLVGAANLYAAVINIKKRPNRYDWAITGGMAITCG